MAQVDRPARIVGMDERNRSAFALLAAMQLGFPTLGHEQNAVLGRANRLLARRAGARGHGGDRAALDGDDTGMVAVARAGGLAPAR